MSAEVPNSSQSASVNESIAVSNDVIDVLVGDEEKQRPAIGKSVNTDTALALEAFWADGVRSALMIVLYKSLLRFVSSILIFKLHFMYEIQ